MSNKIHINITLDCEVVNELKLRIDNISSLINELLITYLQIDKKELKPEKEIDEIINNLTAQLNEVKNQKIIIESNKKRAVDEFDNKLKNREVVIY